MWFNPSGDPRQLLRALRQYVIWLFAGPLVGAVGLVLFAFLIGARGERLVNAAVWGAVFGGMAGVLVVGAKAVADWKVN